MSTMNPEAQSSLVAPQRTVPAWPIGQAAVKVKRRPLHQRLLSLVNHSLVSVIVILIALVWSVPTLGLFISSFRPPALIHTTGWWTALVPPWSFTIENYVNVLQAQGLGLAFLNSLIIAVPGTILPTLVAAFAAYAFAWMDFPGRDWIFLTIVALMVIPVQMTLIPVLSLYTMLAQATGLQLAGSYLGIWLMHTALGLPFAVYLLRNFFAGLPSDLFESARIDGASNINIFFRILLPLSVPSLASLVIFQFMWVWNDLLVALVFMGSNPDRAPMTVTIANLVNSYGSNWEVLTSAAFISMALPLVIFFTLQRYFVRGILAGSVKG
uniref:Sugar ABC transporter permease n=1 Tax=Thermogemmatispora argillosa TaxID=2045280 RepID=A0A455T8I1_9CHLR|nr:sugar ABC transporter permease [Thermogemmatispora argillosa]